MVGKNAVAHFHKKYLLSLFIFIILFIFIYLYYQIHCYLPSIHRRQFPGRKTPLETSMLFREFANSKHRTVAYQRSAGQRTKTPISKQEKKCYQIHCYVFLNATKNEYISINYYS